MDAVQTGIVASDPDRLILKPYRLLLSRRQLGGMILILMAVLLGAAVLLSVVAPAHIDRTTALVVAALIAALWAYRGTTEVTYILLRDSAGVVVETRNPFLHTRTRRLLHAYADITAVELRTRVNPNAAIPGSSPMGAYLHYDLVLRKGPRHALLWYTRYPDAAAQIAATVARFANVPLIDVDRVLESEVVSRAT